MQPQLASFVLEEIATIDFLPLVMGSNDGVNAGACSFTF